MIFLEKKANIFHNTKNRCSILIDIRHFVYHQPDFFTSNLTNESPLSHLAKSPKGLFFTFMLVMHFSHRIDLKPHTSLCQKPPPRAFLWKNFSEWSWKTNRKTTVIETFVVKLQARCATQLKSISIANIFMWVFENFSE